jgi:thiamine phosphate synthase YjbQ (UPF0047 family)
MERLYQPDFTCIFGDKFSNAFSYGNIDSLIWPIFTDITPSDALKKLLQLKDADGNPFIYTRKLSIEDEKIELNCSNIHFALVQAMNTGRSYGISNNDVIELVKKEPNIFKGILSFDMSNIDFDEDICLIIENIQKEIPVCGIVLYPSLIKLNLLDTKNHQLNLLLEYCRKNSLFLKIDLANFILPHNFRHFTSIERIESFLSNFSNNIIILSGVDMMGELDKYIHLLKKYKNLWIEIDPRTIGGLTPTDIFIKIFKIKGFIQNFWYRISIGSATPTLEMSQMVKGFLEATNQLNFPQKNLLRCWAFRNINRLNSQIFKPINELKTNIFIKVKENYDNIYGNQLISSYIFQLRSFSITQLLFLTDIIKKYFKKTLEKYPDLIDGELMIRSYHTTTSLILNEHEYGNYLDLHYHFAELTMQSNSNFMHSVLAKENRPDFNHLDHRIASSFGSKQLIIPIRNGKLEIGSRENFYLLTTFGPRNLNLFLEIKLYKEH